MRQLPQPPRVEKYSIPSKLVTASILCGVIQIGWAADPSIVIVPGKYEIHAPDVSDKTETGCFADSSLTAQAYRKLFDDDNECKIIESNVVNNALNFQMVCHNGPKRSVATIDTTISVDGEKLTIPSTVKLRVFEESVTLRGQATAQRVGNCDN